MKRSPILLLVTAVCALALGTVLFVRVQPVHAATIEVDVNTDNSSVAALDQMGDGPCSLREAINNANNDNTASDDCTTGAGADIITFTVASITLVDDIFVTTDITIDGAGTVDISGGDATRMFVVASSGILTLRSLTLHDGSDGGGGAVMVQDGSATLVCDRSVFRDNVASSDGGAISSSGTVDIDLCLFDGNTAQGDGGAIDMSGAFPLTVDESYFVDNIAGMPDTQMPPVSDGSGGAISSGAPTTITATAFVTNVAHDENATQGGGAIYNFATSVAGMNIVASIFSGNSVVGSDDPDAIPRGGAIFNAGGGNLAIEYSHFGNTPLGDPIPWVPITLPPPLEAFLDIIPQPNTAVRNSPVNLPSEGGAIFTFDPLFMLGTSVVGNTAGNGGGLAIRTTDNEVSIANSTFSGNHADVNGGGIYTFGGSQQIDLYNVTIAVNDADGDGGGIYVNGDGDDVNPIFDDITLFNTIVANNDATTGANCLGIGPGDPISDGGNNLVWPVGADCLAITNIGDPMLDPLEFTFTFATVITFVHPLNPGSAALGTGNQGICDLPPVVNLDQRGLPFIRPVGDPDCDIGAFESSESNTPTNTPTPTPTPTDTPTDTPTPTPTNTPGGPTDTPTPTPTDTQIPTDTPTPTPTNTPGGPTDTPTPTPTDTQIPTDTPTPTPTNTPGGPTDTPTPTPTDTLIPTDTPTPTPTNTPGGPTDTPTNTPTATPTNTPGGPTDTPTNTPTATPTNTPGGPTDTPTNTPTATSTNTPGGPTNTPTVTNTPGGPTDTPTQPSADGTPIVLVIDPMVSKSANPPFAMPGEIVTWTIEVINPGTIPATDIVLVDDLPSEVQFESATWTAGTLTTSGQTVTFTLAVLNPGETVTIVIRTVVRDDLDIPFIITNRVSITNAENPTPRIGEASIASASTLPQTGESSEGAVRLPLLVFLWIVGFLALVLMVKWRNRRVG